jgi:hypothetical protein
MLCIELPLRGFRARARAAPVNAVWRRTSLACTRLQGSLQKCEVVQAGEELDLPGVLLPEYDALPAVSLGSQSVDRLVELAPGSNVHCQLVQLLQFVNAAHLVDQRPKVSFLSLSGHAVRVFSDAILVRVTQMRLKRRRACCCLFDRLHARPSIELSYRQTGSARARRQPFRWS